MGCGSSMDARGYTKVDQSIWRGELKVHLRKATIQKDFQLLGKMDPYIKLTFGKQQKTSNVCEDGGQFPVWKNESFSFKRSNEEDVIYIQMWNKNAIQSDDFIGEGGFALTKVRQGTTSKVDQNCVIFGKNKEIGNVEFALEFVLDPECKNHPEILAQDTTGQLIVRPKNAILQRDTTFLFGSMAPVCLVKLGDDYQTSGANLDGGKNPRWEDQLIFTRETVQRDTLTIECQNFNESDDNDQIGVGFLSLTSCLPKDAKPTKTVDLYFEGHIVGNLSLEMEYIPDNVQQEQPQQQQQQQQQPQQQQQQQQPQVQQNQIAPAPMYQPQQPILPSNGHAEYRYPNGDFYQGEWSQGLKQGNGRMQYMSSMLYEGQWANDYFHGEGKLTVSGTIYTGQFLNGKKNGQGTIVWHGSQQKYEGEWRDNKYDGIGTWTHPNGQSYKAEFRNGQKVRVLDQQPQNFLAAGRCLQQGGQLPSDDGMFTLFLAYNGAIQIFQNQTRQIFYQISNFPQAPMAPFFLRLELDGRLNAIDGTGRTYYCSRQPNIPMQGQPPFKLVMQNDGKIAVHDASQAIWYSH